METVNAITRIMFDGQSFPLEASNGRKNFNDLRNIIWVSPNFKKFKLNKPSRSKKINVVVHEMTADGTLFEIFSSIDQDLNKLVMKIANVLEFCEKYPDKLRQQGFSTFFLVQRELNIFQKMWHYLFGIKPEYFVVRVIVPSDGLGADVLRLERVGVWRGECRHRVVSPQLIPLAE